jgi:CBS domain-containing protein
MRDNQISRLPVVDHNEHLVGMVTRFDLREILATPQERPGHMDALDGKKNHLAKHLDGHYKKFVHTLPATAIPPEIIDILVTNNVGSVVIVNGVREPIGLISTTDVLHAIDRTRPVAQHALELNVSPDFIHETQLIELLNQFTKKVEKSYPITGIQAVLKTEKNAAGKIKLYEFSAHVMFSNKYKSDGTQHWT